MAKIHQAIILSAGRSLRFWPLNYQHKSLVKILGKPIILYLIESLRREGIKDIIVIQGRKKNIEKELKEYKIPGLKFVVQPEAKGSGEAILRAKKYLKDDYFFVLNAERIDAKDYIPQMLSKLEKVKEGIIILAGETIKPWLFGILELKKDRVLKIIEKPSRGSEPSNIKIVGTYLFPKEFINYLERVPVKPYSLEDALSLYAKDKEIRVVMAKRHTFSLKFPWDLFDFVEYIMEGYLDKRVKKSTSLRKEVKIKGEVYVGNNVKIFENAVIKGPCYIGNNVVIGNNVLIREYTNLEDGVIVGANAEVARSVFQESSHIHSGYFGDSIIGRGTKIGAGAVTANLRLDRGEIKAVVKGKKVGTHRKHLGIITGENVSVGINVSFMPGVMIGSNSIVGPSSLVKNNVKDGEVFYTELKRIRKMRKDR